MNFPLDEPFFRFLYWLANTPGLGGIAMAGIAGGLLVAFGGALRWITSGAKAEEVDEYPYPTSALRED